jgi:hypothetical protein
VPSDCWSANFTLYSVDHVALGRGEVLIRETTAPR